MSDKHVRTCAKRADKVINQTRGSVWETLEQRRKMARICSLFQAPLVKGHGKLWETFCRGHFVALLN
jgi:hypothetical protein